MDMNSSNSTFEIIMVIFCIIIAIVFGTGCFIGWLLF